MGIKNLASPIVLTVADMNTALQDLASKIGKRIPEAATRERRAKLVG